MITGEKMSRLRVIGGIAKGKRLKTRNVKHLRPATDFVKEALFNILTNQVPGSLFLDLFAGSGSIGG
jgi:16S rRNA (guanine966-N2)-methyltransferase